MCVVDRGCLAEAPTEVREAMRGTHNKKADPEGNRDPLMDIPKFFGRDPSPGSRSKQAPQEVAQDAF